MWEKPKHILLSIMITIYTYFMISESLIKTIQLFKQHGYKKIQLKMHLFHDIDVIAQELHSIALEFRAIVSNLIAQLLLFMRYSIPQLPIANYRSIYNVILIYFYIRIYSILATMSNQMNDATYRPCLSSNYIIVMYCAIKQLGCEDNKK